MGSEVIGEAAPPLLRSYSTYSPRLNPRAVTFLRTIAAISWTDWRVAITSRKFDMQIRIFKRSPHKESESESKNPLGGVGGAPPPTVNPKTATCAVASEALRSKVSLHPSPTVSMTHR